MPLLRRPAAWLYSLAAAGCSLLALANAPIGPSYYSPALTGFRDDVGEGPTLVLASDRLLEDEHGTPYIVWELRGGRVCIDAAEEAGSHPPHGVHFVVTEVASRRAAVRRPAPRRVAHPYVLWEGSAIAGQSPCPLIAVRQAARAAR